MKYKYCRYENVTNVIKHSRSTIGIITGIALMFGLIKIIPDKIFIFILPVIGGFVAGIISSNESITITDTNNEQQELNAGGAAGIIFGIIICFVGTLFLEWTDLTEMAYLVVSPYGKNSHLFSLLFIAIILILSYFSWGAILIFSLITVCFFVHPPYSLINTTYDAAFDILLANIPIMGLICGVLGSSGNKLSKMFLDCLPNLYYTIVNVNFIKRVLHALSNKFVKSFFIILIIVTITSTVILFSSLKEQEEKVEFSPIEVSNIKVDTPKFEYYGIPLLKKYATEIALEDYPDVDRGYINNLVGKAASLSTANLSITLSIYNPNNKNMKLDEIDYTIYEIIPDYVHANILLRRYIKSDTYTEEAITLPPHTTTVVSLNPKLGILQSGILRLDESMLDCTSILLKVKGILYSEDSRYYFEQNTSIGELISEYVKIEIKKAKHPCIITQKDWDLYYPCIKRDDYITLTIDELDRPRIDIGAYYGRYGPYVPIIFDGLAKLEYPEHYGKEYHFDNGIKEYIHLWTINYTVYCDEDDVIIEDYLRQNYGVPANITIIRK